MVSSHPFSPALVAMLQQQTLGPVANHCLNPDAVSGHNGCLSLQACKRAEDGGREGRQAVATIAKTAARVWHGMAGQGRAEGAGGRLVELKHLAWLMSLAEAHNSSDLRQDS